MFIFLSLAGLITWVLYKYVKSLKVSPQNKIVVITGCDTGFGNLLAKRLASMGMTVLAGCLYADSENAKELEECSTNIHIYPLDVSQNDSVDKFKQFVHHKASKSGVWAVVNNAGIPVSGEIEFTPLSEYERIFQINVMGVVRITKALLPLVKQSCGRIVHLASIMSHAHTPQLSAYCMSKAAVLTFSDALRFEMSKFGVLSISIEPYFFQTNIVSVWEAVRMQQKYIAQTPDEVKQTYDAAYMQAYFKSFELGEAEAISDLSLVLNGLEHAILACYPNRHYRMNWKSDLTMLLSNYLPSFLLDRVFLSRLSFYKFFKFHAQGAKSYNYFL